MLKINGSRFFSENAVEVICSRYINCEIGVAGNQNIMVCMSVDFLKQKKNVVQMTIFGKARLMKNGITMKKK